MTVGLWGCAMFPIMHPTRSARVSASPPPSPPVSPLLATSAGSLGPFFRLDVGTPPLTARATSTPLPRTVTPRGSPSRSPPRTTTTSTTSQVIVAEDIPLHAASRTFQPAELLRKDDADLVGEVRLRLSADGYLDTESGSTSSWVRRVRLADDCHSANVQLQASAADGCVRVRAVRPLSRGQSPLLWFADDLLACLRLPFLAPHNIQGEKRYVCHHCERTFEFPNPLKLHLSLDCSRDDVAELWRRLHHGLRKDTSAFRPYWDSSADSGVAGSLSGSLNASLSPGLNGGLNGHAHAGHVPSLFGAFHHWALTSTALRPTPTLGPAPRPAHLLPRPLPPPAEPLGLGLLGGHHLGGHDAAEAPVRTHRAHRAHQASYHQHASDMETLVSNLGRSKQGHLCIYCGKVYSRKYGLKIHIRTHTGFKPLKCKYCLRPFGDPSNLNKHVRLHAEGDTPYKCDLCGKVLVRRRDLERHVKSRHQEGGDWDLDTDQDQDDVEVDVGDEGHDEEDDEDEASRGAATLHCNGNPLSDITIPSV